MEPTIPHLIVLASAAFAASVVGGIAGYGTGLLLPPVLVPLIGAEAVVPVIGLSALLTNAGRLFAWRRELDRRAAGRILLASAPGVALGAVLYTLLSGPRVMVLIGATLIALVPMRRRLVRRHGTLGPRGQALAAAGYGVLNGGTAGSGVILLSLLLAAGLSGPAVIATDAAISIALGTLKSLIFAGAGALTWHLAGVALLIGLAALPGAFVARRLARRLDASAHVAILDAVVLLGGTLLIAGGLRH
ncbi:MAG: sulfite exporter TauE/SafE family protein [Rhodobacteraceae bacterium]|nr:sulfite exporter TauE/SafE family protein [Paracoccaceae bacterium]